VSQFNMPIGTLGLFMIVIMRLLPVAREAISACQGILSNWKSLMVMDERMQSILAAREPLGGSRELGALRKGIRFDNVSYTYKGEVPALAGVSCEIAARSMTAIVGPSGSGKSTFVDMLPRLRDPDSGTILFDGVPLNDYAVKSLRAGTAFVPQAPQIFNVTVAEHIRYGKADATDAEVREAARLAGAAEFIERLPGGYEAMLGENGGRLSGGQRQRLDIARALVRRAPIVIFDEPTSQLDAESETQFRDALRRIKAETEATIIIVGHRLSTVMEADQIIVFEGGVVTEAGSHHELMRRRGWYAGAFARQFDKPVELRVAAGAQ